jgi:hypothetical protein
VTGIRGYDQSKEHRKSMLVHKSPLELDLNRLHVYESMKRLGAENLSRLLEKQPNRRDLNRGMLKN